MRFGTIKLFAAAGWSALLGYSVANRWWTEFPPCPCDGEIHHILAVIWSVASLIVILLLSINASIEEKFEDIAEAIGCRGNISFGATLLVVLGLPSEIVARSLYVSISVLYRILSANIAKR